MAVNFPFRLVGGAAVKAWADGSGNIPLRLRSGARVGYVVMWPHVRPWHLVNPQPMLRGVPEVRKVASILARALLDADPSMATQAQPAAPVLGHGAPPSDSSMTRASAAA
jgi:hypothetical protein